MILYIITRKVRRLDPNRVSGQASYLECRVIKKGLFVDIVEEFVNIWLMIRGREFHPEAHGVLSLGIEHSWFAHSDVIWSEHGPGCFGGRFLA